MFFLIFICLQLISSNKNDIFIDKENNEEKSPICNEYCSECSTDENICKKCQDYFGFNHEDPPQCKRCKLSNCIECYEDFSKCQKCKIRYGVDLETGECKDCSISLCYDCSHNYLDCEECINGYSPISVTHEDGTVTHICEKCRDNYCDSCEENLVVCHKCKYRFGLDPKTNKCRHCDSNCNDCSDNCNYCNECKDRFGFEIVDGINTHKCKKCKDDKCNFCGNDYTKCYQCYDGFGFKDKEGIKTCTKCNVKYCKKCYNYTICTECFDGYYFEQINGVKTGKCIQSKNDFCDKSDENGNCKHANLKDVKIVQMIIKYAYHVQIHIQIIMVLK